MKKRFKNPSIVDTLVLVVILLDTIGSILATLIAGIIYHNWEWTAIFYISMMTFSLIGLEHIKRIEEKTK